MSFSIVRGLQKCILKKHNKSLIICTEETKVEMFGKDQTQFTLYQWVKHGGVGKIIWAFSEAMGPGNLQ